MKIAIIIDCPSEKIDALKACVSEFGYTSIVTNNPEEIEQTGHQIGQFLMCFMDPKTSYKFLKDKQWRHFKTLNLLFLDGQPKMTEETQSKIKEINLNFVVQYDRQILTQLLSKFESGGNKEDEKANVVEIEFLSTMKVGSDDEAA